LTVVSVEHSNFGCTNPDEFGVTDTALERFAKGHHSTHQVSDTEVIHIYAIAGKPVFTNLERYDFDIKVPFAGAVWEVSFSCGYRAMRLLILLGLVSLKVTSRQT
jgi:hypothetical protein